MPDVPERRNLPGVEGLEWPELPVALTLSEPVPALPVRQFGPCPVCEGFGTIAKDCEECRGTGRAGIESPYKLPWADVTVRLSIMHKVKLYLPGARIIKAGKPVDGKRPIVQVVFDGGGSAIFGAVEPEPGE